MISEDLATEIEAINAIFGAMTLASTELPNIMTLTLPKQEVTLRLSFPSEYPELPPQILGTETVGNGLPKGYGKHALDIAKDILKNTYQPGEVCIYDMIQETKIALESDFWNIHTTESRSGDEEEVDTKTDFDEEHVKFEPPQWVISEPVTEKKSVFIARACAVHSPLQARSHISHLIQTDKKVAKATHNISAYRIRSADTKIIYQDCDDDGENAAGGRLLHLLQVMDAWKVLVVVSRWYGGVQLGPDRFRIINAVAREAVVKGGWVKEAEKRSGKIKG